MKILTFFSIFGLLITLSASPSLAAPFKAENNPQIVANYSEGEHGIPGQTYTHEGKDVVMKAGNSPVVQQWFVGTSEEEGFHGEHSVWKLSKDGTCPPNWFQMTPTEPDGGNYWGDVMEFGQTYCIMTNQFLLGKNK